MKNNATKVMLSVFLLIGLITNFCFAETFNMELLAWARYGDCEAVAASGNYVYAGNNGVLQVYDVSNDNHQFLSEVQCPGILDDIVVAGNYLYAGYYNEGIVAEGNGICIINIADPSNVEIVTSFDIDEGVGGLAVENENLYVATNDTVTFVYNVSDLNNITETDAISYEKDSDSALDIAVKDNFVFIAVDEDGMKIFNLDDKSLVKHIAVEDGGFADQTNRMDIEGDYLYMVDENGKLWIVNIADPVNAAIEASITIADGENLYDVDVYEGNVYVASYDNTAYKVDLTDVTNPVVTSVSTDHQNYRIACTNGKAFLASEEDGTAVIRVAFNDDCEYITSAGELTRLNVNEEIKKVYAIADNQTLYIMDWTNPMALETVYYTNDYSESVTSNGNYLYVSGDSTVRVYEVPEEVNAFAQPTVVAEVGHEIAGFDPDPIDVDGDYLYVVDEANNTVVVFDITDPASPVYHMTFEFDGSSPKHVDVKNGVCAVSAYSAGLPLFDVTDIANKNVELKVQKPQAKVYEAAIKDQNVFYANYGDPSGIRVLTWSMGWEYAGVAVDSAFAEDTFYGLDVCDNSNYVFGAADDDPVRMWEFDPTFTTTMGSNFIGSFDIPGDADIYDIEATEDGGLVFVAAGGVGLMLLHNQFVDVAVDDDEIIAEQFELHQNYPNPFNPTTTISYSIPTKMNVEISVYDMMGRKISTLVKQPDECRLSFSNMEC